jgi:hypothetical protein
MSTGVGYGQVARVLPIDRPIKGHYHGLQGPGAYRRQLPRRCDRAGVIRGSDAPMFDRMPTVTSCNASFSSARRMTLTQLHASGFSGNSAAALVLRQVIGQGYLQSSLDIFYFSGWLVMLLIPLCWLVRRPSGAAVARRRIASPCAAPASIHPAPRERQR